MRLPDLAVAALLAVVVGGVLGWERIGGETAAALVVLVLLVGRDVVAWLLDGTLDVVLDLLADDDED